MKITLENRVLMKLAMEYVLENHPHRKYSIDEINAHNIDRLWNFTHIYATKPTSNPAQKMTPFNPTLPRYPDNSNDRTVATALKWILRQWEKEAQNSGPNRN